MEASLGYMRSCLQKKKKAILNYQFDLILVLLGFFVLFFRTGFLYVTVLAVLELAIVDQVGFKFTEICLLLPPMLRLMVCVTKAQLDFVFKWEDWCI